jgi:hypothetical protein
MRSCTRSVLCLLLLPAAMNAADESPLTFEQHVRPILKAHCFHCHGEAPELGGGLDLRLVRLMQAGGDSGTAVQPGDPESSLLWLRIAADEMPEGPRKLPTADKDVVRRWIRRGARTARPEPEDPEDARVSSEELAHWAYQPVSRPEVPRPAGYELQTPVDGFIAARLAAHELDFSPAADRRTLIRRVSFDLLGLPPTPAEVNAFLADRSPDAYARLVDRLLASPHFGVRWGRHWLDVAGYAETDGGQEADTRREHAWRYRDYVIDAFNENRPINQFYIEQLAGDELLEGPVDIDNPRHYRLLTATGFLRMAPDPTQSNNTLAERNMAAAAALQVMTSAMLATTVGCAQCHDHRYDPIGIDDYYRLRAVFDPVFSLRDWQTPLAQLVDFTPPEVAAERERIETRARAREGDLNRRRNEHGRRIQELKLADVPETDRAATRAAVLTAPSQRTPEQKRLLDQYPMVKPVSSIVGLLVEYDSAAFRKFQQEQEQIAALRATRPPIRMVMATRERPGVIPVSHVLFRGDPESPGEEVAPAELTVLSRGREAAVPADDGSRPTSGRRLAYARQLTDGSHPLAARAFVNRLWLHHFGRGLVATPGDFGLAGEKPSHPDLLDWLADDFVRHGWNQKRVHRLILLSRTYRQSSRRARETNAVDPENTLLSHMNLRRLEAEAIRDALLAVAGQLNPQLGGPSVPVTESPEGKIVLGTATTRQGLKTGVDGVPREAGRRSAYVEVQRRLPLDMLATFDLPDMSPNCHLRHASTVATQALWFLNDAVIVEKAEAVADLLLRSSPDEQACVEHLFLRLFATSPTEEELRLCRDYLATQREQLAAGRSVQTGADAAGPDPDRQALATLCQALLASNRFLYVD